MKLSVLPSKNSLARNMQVLQEYFLQVLQGFVNISLSRAGVVLAIVSASSLLFNVTLTQFYTCMQAIYTNYNDKAYCT